MSESHKKKIKCELYNDNFQNFKKYGIPKAQLVIADIPYNLAENAYASNPMWYKGGDNITGLGVSKIFNSDGSFDDVDVYLTTEGD